MAKDNVDVGKLKKFYKELARKNKEITLDLFKNKSVLCSEYIENLKQPKGFVVMGEKIYYNEQEIGTFKVKKFGLDSNTNTNNNDIDLNNINIAPRRNILTNIKDRVLGFINRPASEELQKKIHKKYNKNYSLINRLLDVSRISFLTREEINSLRRYKEKYDRNQDIFASLFVSGRKAKSFLSDLQYEMEAYLDRFNNNMKTKERVNRLYDELSQMSNYLDSFSDEDRKSIRTAFSAIRRTENEINDRYFFDNELIEKELDLWEEIIEDLKNAYGIGDVQVYSEPQPLAGPPSVDEHVVNVEPKQEPLPQEDLKEMIEKEKRVREKTNGFSEALDDAHKKYEEEMKKLQDQLYDDAVELVINDQKASIGYLQRKLRIGFNRAKDLMDSLEANGIVGPEKEYGKRDALVNNEEQNSNDDIDLDNIVITSSEEPKEELKKSDIKESEPVKPIIPEFLRRPTEEDLDDDSERKIEDLKEMIKNNREAKKEEQERINSEIKESEDINIEPDVDFDSLDKRIYDKYSVSDINELKDKIEDINSKIIEKNEKIERKEKQILETEVALDNAIKADDTENIDKYTEKLEKQRNKLEELKDKAEKLENKKEKKESVISRFKDESIRVYEESEREKQEEFEKEEQAMNERLEKEAIEERDKNRKEISKLFKNASDDEISPLTYKTKKEVQQYVSYIEKLKEEGKDPQEFIDKYDKALREERKASNNLKEIEDEINSDNKKSSRKK